MPHPKLKVQSGKLVEKEVELTQTAQDTEAELNQRIEELERDILIHSNQIVTKELEKDQLEDLLDEL